ncbi:MAG: indoleacetate decarboxylase activase [Acidaminococcales bacterium]|jgi:pyruvate formate lyase activating enzyme|nr:indoleacetate decarboxylase activase [Acidaminococcales bacterium]
MGKKLELKALIFDIQSFSTHDGPGIRTNVFFKGCPLRCLWCANPEGQLTVPELFYTKAKCVSCGRCARACPHGAVTAYSAPADSEKFVFVRHDRAKCNRCQTHDCVRACLQNALSVTGEWLTIDAVMKKIRRDSSVYRHKGGITVSGGDPLIYYEFVAELLKTCREEGINTALESELSVPMKNLEQVVPYVDLYLPDLKVVDEEKHIAATGFSNKLTMENLRFLGQTCPEKICLRVPIIPMFTDSDENIAAIGTFCAKNHLPRVNILPYHKLGSTKHERLGGEYPMPDLPAPDDGKMRHIADIIESCGVECIIN